MKVVALCGSMLVATGCATCCRGDKNIDEVKVEKKTVDVEVRPTSGIIQFDEKDMPKVYFDYDKFDIRADQQARADKCVEFLKANPTKKVRIEGNCDDRGTTEYNLSLGERRAKAVADYLTGHGIAKDRVSTLTKGEENPADMGKTEEAYAKNRRDEFFDTTK